MAAVVDIFDKLNRIIDSFVDADTEAGSERFDPDYSDAWQELESFMGDEQYDAPRGRSGAGTAGGRGGTSRRAGGGIPRELERDFHNLEISPGADWKAIQRAYKSQLAQFHPDRFAANPKKYATATEITKQINYSYQRLKQYYQGREPG